MNITSRFGQRTSFFLLRKHKLDTHLTVRSFFLTSASSALRYPVHHGKPRWQQTRSFSQPSSNWAAVQPAPQADAYLASGAVEPGKNLVHVNKVLVIGSGGLSIGQAGEFDYSGKVFAGSASGHCFRYCCIEKFRTFSMADSWLLRLTSTESVERSGRCIRANQSQHCHHSDRSQAS